MAEVAFPEHAPVVRLIGETPLVDLSALSPNPAVTIQGKLEQRNPGGSIKDRPALYIARAAWPELARGATLVDATSGNTGIAYALLGRALGFPVHLFMPENASEERKRTFQLYGARLTLTPAEEGQDGAIEACQAYLAEDQDAPIVYADQYSNEANPLAHERTTGPEIDAQSGAGLTHFVAGIGTGGTLTGTARYLAKHRPGVQIVGLQPAEPLHGMEGWKHLATNKVPAILDPSVMDEERTVGTLAAWDTGARLLTEVGLALGPSAGAAVAACCELASELEEGHLVTILPDGFERYQSTRYAEHVLETVQTHPGADA
ncbi:MAG: PLP-dependent cysteine synthase family protein [Candidatus Thermoplasmatota archaeon]|nr:PLP-dependent cysteine synthase family protein [Candidatus Thermoplasmatota archaeon]